MMNNDEELTAQEKFVLSCKDNARVLTEQLTRNNVEEATVPQTVEDSTPTNPNPTNPTETKTVVKETVEAKKPVIVKPVRTQASSALKPNDFYYSPSYLPTTTPTTIHHPQTRSNNPTKPNKYVSMLAYVGKQTPSVNAKRFIQGFSSLRPTRPRFQIPITSNITKTTKRIKKQFRKYF